jgi:hypothetical protein
MKKSKKQLLKDLAAINKSHDIKRRQKLQQIKKFDLSTRKKSKYWIRDLAEKDNYFRYDKKKKHFKLKQMSKLKADILNKYISKDINLSSLARKAKTKEKTLFNEGIFNLTKARKPRKLRLYDIEGKYIHTYKIRKNKAAEDIKRVFDRHYERSQADELVFTLE